jgi:peptide/nickel transport system permease protein
MAMLRSPVVIITSSVLLLLFVISLIAPWIIPHDPLQNNLQNRLLPPAWMEGGDPRYLLGTDHLGRDVLTWLIMGTRTSFLLSIGVIMISAIIGTALGIISGYVGGKIDAVIMRMVDFFMSFPLILFALMMSVILGQGILVIVLIVTLNVWANYARMARGETLRIKPSEFVEIARMLGVSRFKIMWRHIFPNVVTPLVILATLSVGKCILFLSTLSFLGIGLPISTPDWGIMISNGRDYLSTAWWIAIFPSAAITIVIMCFNLLGDKLTEYINPDLKNEI